MEIKGIPPNAMPIAELTAQKSLKPTGLSADKNAGASKKGAVRDAVTVSKGGDQGAALKKAAHDFEALFVGMMLKSMRETVGKDQLTGGGRGEETFRSLLDQEYANNAADTGSLGLAAMIEKQLGNGSDPTKR